MHGKWSRSRPCFSTTRLEGRDGPISFIVSLKLQERRINEPLLICVLKSFSRLISFLHVFVLHLKNYTHSMRLRLPFFFLLPSAYATVVTITAHTTIHTTIGAAATPTPPSTQYTSPRAFQRAILETHNFYRREHNASALAWNNTSAAYAADWAEACEFEHSVCTYILSIVSTMSCA